MPQRDEPTVCEKGRHVNCLHSRLKERGGGPPVPPRKGPKPF
ncbi:MAG TPA: hypothetical protein VHI93_04005 [Candidatus Thermoplasmatota archaeon]|nr:hypothetical protein [Candidatus Thermoplasmatota archaeon]